MTLVCVTQPITSELIARTGSALAADGWRYTPRQLYYATCAAAETPRRSPGYGQIALGALLGLVALILLPVRPAAAVVGAFAAVAIALGLMTRWSHRPAAGRVLAVSFAEFETLLAGDDAPSGLVTEPHGTPAASPPARVVVCDTADNAAAVAANVHNAGLPAVEVVTVDAIPPGTPSVIALHDASPSGCALPLELADSGVAVVDAGLRPAWVDGNDMQVLEGAPARLPRDLMFALTEPEEDWLRSGRRVELAVLPPPRLMRLVTVAVERAGAEPPVAGVPAGVAAAPPSLP